MPPVQAWMPPVQALMPPVQDDTRALSRGIQRVASRIARALNRMFSRRGRFFVDRFHGRVIKTPRDMRNTLAYVLLNRHKDAARRGRTVRGVDVCSSGMHFDGWKNVGPLVPHPGERAPPVTRPRSWLVSKGWRRCGLIHTQERRPRCLRAHSAAGPSRSAARR